MRESSESEEHPAFERADTTVRRNTLDRVRYFELAPDLFAITDGDAMIKQVNPAWFRVLGWEPNDITGRRFSDFIHFDDQTLAGDTLLNFHKFGRVDDVELRMRSRDGRYHWVVWSAVGQPGGNLISAVGRDVTADRAERARLDRLKDDFLSTVSHELRTPLTSIRGALGLLESGIFNDNSEKTEKLVQIAKANCDRVILLVNDMLDMQNIESGLIHFNLLPSDVGEVVRRTVEATDMYANLHNVQVSFVDAAAPLIASIDPSRIEQVVTNLLSNAIKFSPKGGEVIVRVARCPGGIRVSVTDFGSGIPEAFQPRVFERFTQAESDNARRHEGSGLGLHISKLIVQRHEGQIGFDTVVNEGTQFWFEVPAAASRRRRASTEDIPTVMTTTRRVRGERPVVLHVEPNEDLCEIVRAQIGDSVRLHTVATAKAARGYFRENFVDLVILEPELADSEGLRLIPRLRVVQPGTPIVIFSETPSPTKAVANVEVWLQKTRTTEAELAAIVRTLLPVQTHSERR